MTVEERVNEVLKKLLLINAEQITPESHLVDDLGVTSLDRLELVMGIEDEFGVEFTGAEQESILTVRDIIERVKRGIAE